jgi:nudix-type nucleoside diphosphatase (YffH/AdpP family)
MTDISDRVRIADTKLLSDNWYILNRVTFAWRRNDGRWNRMTREVYDRGNGAAILLYNTARRTVVLTRQFRMPAFVNGYHDMMIEAAAGLLDNASPKHRIRAEAEEETGYRVRDVTKVFDLFMSPGSMTERFTLFVASYRPADRIGAGGGLPGEGEDIDVLELGFDEAMEMVEDGRICDAKTVVLLQWAKMKVFG